MSLTPATLQPSRQPLGNAMNVNALDRLVLQVTLLAGLIALVLLPW